jgi:hypothetical protein
MRYFFMRMARPNSAVSAIVRLPCEESTIMPIKIARFAAPAAVAIVSIMAGLRIGAAQEQPYPGAMSPGMAGRGAMMCRMDEHIDGQLAYLKAELKITDIQLPQWNIFAQAFRAETEKKAQLCREAMEQARAGASAGLLDSLKMTEDQMAKRLDSLRAMRAAVLPLYSVLTKEQKKTADEIMKNAPNS